MLSEIRYESLARQHLLVGSFTQLSESNGDALGPFLSLNMRGPPRSRSALTLSCPDILDVPAP